MKNSFHYKGHEVPLYTQNSLIIGTGAAGLSVAATMIECGFTDFKIINPMIRFIGAGASYCSGSDKQTVYKVGNFGSIADSPYHFAETLYNGGCMNGYEALIEGNYSLRGFYRLTHLGVSFPHTANGAYVGYKTDHDPYARADSVGPRTSQTMVKSLAGYVKKSCPDCILNGFEVIDLIIEKNQIKGIIALDVSKWKEPNKGISAFIAHNVVMATGGPGQLYRDSVLPFDMYGTHGLALRRGATGTNFAEMQFGIGTGSGSDNFPWNLSGTYMQVLPDVFSTDSNDASGRRNSFLCNWFPDMGKMATAIFLKGYQWPFHAEKMEDHGSSLFDIAVREEIQKGRKVWLDFWKNPQHDGTMENFHFGLLEDEARQYLEKNQATQELPIERLRVMNPLAIELYEKNRLKIDTEKQPLRFAVNYQHQNGGMLVNEYGMSNIKNLYFNGEAAGTHGVTRPGGASLNMGQALGIHIAETIIARHNLQNNPVDLDLESNQSLLEKSLNDNLSRIESFYNNSNGPTSKEVIGEIKTRMMEYASFVVTMEGVKKAFADAKDQFQALRKTGIKLADGQEGKQLRMCFVAEDMVLTQLAVLKTLEHYLKHGGGSRGSRAVLSKDGVGQVMKKGTLISELSYKKKKLSDDEIILNVEWDREKESFIVQEQKRYPLPSLEEVNEVVFELEWNRHRDRMNLKD